MNRKTLVLTVYIFLFLSLFDIVGAAGLPAGYSSKSSLLSKFAVLCSKHDSVKNSTVGYTVKGFPIYLFILGNLSMPRVLVDAEMHGNEYANSEVLYLLAIWISESTDAEAAEIRLKCCVLLIPFVNYDNYGLSRYNAHGVDLNRNFEYGWGKFNDTRRGSYPLSEPESSVIAFVLKNYTPNWYLNLHTGDYRISPPWASQNYVPYPDTYKAVYDKYKSLSRQKGIYTIPYSIRCNYAGGTARDEGQYCGVFSYVVETSYSLTPSYSTMKSSMLPKVKMLLIAVCYYLVGK